jgi:hypothetical protein
MRERIDIHNYEAWLLDFFEGTLNTTEVNELKAFLVVHPELEIDLNETELPVLEKDEFAFEHFTLKKSFIEINDDLLINYVEGNLNSEQKKELEGLLKSKPEKTAELELYKKTILPKEEIDFDYKNSLLKTEEDLILNNIPLAYVEGEVFTEKNKYYETILKDAAFIKEAEAYKKTFLQPELELVYPNKEALKKESKILALFHFRTVAAAASILLIMALGILFLFNTETNGSSLVKTDSAIGFLKNVQGNVLKEQNAIDAFAYSIKKDAGLKRNNTYNSSEKVGDIISEPIPTLNDTQIQLAINSATKNDTASFSEPKDKTVIKENVIRYTQETLLAMVDEEEDEEEKTPKTGFWKRAVKFANQVNGLGLKAVKGDDRGEEYSLSFNSFSIEKK